MRHEKVTALDCQLELRLIALADLPDICMAIISRLHDSGWCSVPYSYHRTA
jgi:hypothetical protein